MQNASIYFNGEIPRGTELFGYGMVGIALCLMPALILHAHVTFGWAEGKIARQTWQFVLIAAGYLPCIYYFFLLPEKIYYGYPNGVGFPLVGSMYSRPYGVWLASALIGSAACQIIFAIRTRTGLRWGTHLFLATYFSAVAYAAFCLLTLTSNGPVWWDAATIVRIWGRAFGLSSFTVAYGLIGAWIIPSVLVVYSIIRFNFLGFKSQRNLVYAVSGTFLALLYLGVVRKVSSLLEPVLPPEATSAILLFTLVIFFEPLQRVASRILRRGFQEQVDRLQRLNSELQQEAHRGKVGRLLGFAEEHIRTEFGLEEVRIQLNNSAAGERAKNLPVEKRPAWAGQPVRLQLGKPGAEIGELVAVPIGSAISGETSAALDFLAEQLPAVIELCRVIEEKVALERELDERERMALVGQMAASISHNLKNPLGSMKTVLQVQLENKALPEEARCDMTMVLGELDRLIAKLTQLLRYAKPAVRPGAAPQTVNISAVAEQTVVLLRHEAERRGGQLDLEDLSGGGTVPGSEESLADIFSNLVVNALEVMPQGGTVSVKLAREDSHLLIEVTDDGPGIPPEDLTRLFKPFFTTKPSGTGLGLAIVERRVTELGGSVSCESPVANGRGARFRVQLPIA